MTPKSMPKTMHGIATKVAIIPNFSFLAHETVPKMTPKGPRRMGMMRIERIPQTSPAMAKPFAPEAPEGLVTADVWPWCETPQTEQKFSPGVAGDPHPEQNLGFGDGSAAGCAGRLSGGYHFPSDACHHPDSVISVPPPSRPDTDCQQPTEPSDKPSVKNGRRSRCVEGLARPEYGGRQVMECFGPGPPG